MQVTLPGGETVPLEEIAAVWRLLQGDVLIDDADYVPGHYEAISGVYCFVAKTPWAALAALAAKVDGTAAEKGEGT